MIPVRYVERCYEEGACACNQDLTIKLTIWIVDAILGCAQRTILLKMASVRQAALSLCIYSRRLHGPYTPFMAKYLIGHAWSV